MWLRRADQEEPTTKLNFVCLVLRHRWAPADETNEAALRLACKRCGKVRSIDGITPKQARRRGARWGERREPR
jgi:hypothetical protein